MQVGNFIDEKHFVYCSLLAVALIRMIVLVFVHGLFRCRKSVATKVTQLTRGEARNSVVCDHYISHTTYQLPSSIFLSAMTCGKNEEYKSCGTLCQKTCNQLDGEMTTKCYNDTCNEGCYCKEGYVLNDKGNCVELKQCSRKRFIGRRRRRIYICEDILEKTTQKPDLTTRPSNGSKITDTPSPSTEATTTVTGGDTQQTTPGSNSSVTVTSSTASTTTTTTTTVSCTETELIETLVASNLIQIRPTEPSNIQDLISKGVDFNSNSPSIEIDLPKRGAVVRDVKLHSKNIAEIEVIFVIESGVKLPAIRGSPTVLPYEQFPTEKVREILINVLKTTDNASPQDVTLCVIVCGEDIPTTTSTTTITTSTVESTEGSTTATSVSSTTQSSDTTTGGDVATETLKVTPTIDATTTQTSSTSTTPFTCTEQEYIDLLVSTNAIRIRPNDEGDKKDLVSKGLDVTDERSTFKIDLPDGGLIVRNVQISSLNILKVEVIFVSETGITTKTIQGKPTSLPVDEFPTERTGELIIKVLETSYGGSLKQVKLSIIACEETFTTTTTSVTSASTFSTEPTTSTQPTTTTTIKFCDEMELINTLIATNSIRTIPTDFYNKGDLITKGVDFTKAQSTIVIDLPANGAIVRNVKLSSTNVARIEVILTMESSGTTVSIQGAPTALPLNEFPTEKVKQITVKFLNTIDDNAPEDVVLSVIACAEGSVTTPSPSTTTSTTTQILTTESTNPSESSSTGSSATTEQSSSTTSELTSTATTTTTTVTTTTTTKFCDEMELVGLLLANDAVSSTCLDRVDKMDLIRKGVNLSEKNPVFVIDIPKGGAIVRDIRLPSKNIAEIEVIFTTESGLRVEPIRGSPTSLPKQNFPLEKVGEIIIIIKATTDDNFPQEVTLSVIVCTENFIVTTVTSKCFDN